MAAAEVQAPLEQDNAMESSENKSFSSRLYELPVVVAAIEQLGQLYGTVKERNSVTKMACNAGESTLSVVTSVSKPIIEKATNTAFTLATPVVGKVEDPVGTIDHVASETLSKVEEKFPIITKSPTEIAEITKSAVTSRAYGYYENVQNLGITKIAVERANDLVSFTELVAEIALPTDGTCKEDMDELAEADNDRDQGLVVRAKHLGSRVTRRGKRKLLTYKPVKATADVLACANERLHGVADMSADAGKKVYDAYMYIPNTAVKISGEVIVSAKEFVFAFSNAHDVKDLPAAILNLSKKAVDPLSNMKDSVMAYVFVPSQVVTEYVLSSRPVQWIIPQVVSTEDMSNLEISMEEIEDDLSDSDKAKESEIK
ncbi:uncharacterized protein LOC116290565 [Actinia tenebrosa]|uniref:Uncharacterized protein LOC116290565 n=1 Tax=Actinia tenebrosa TaxID=6105 RepID=A0A6P8HLJ6_ACTTE|nr:uncharacterized protein LOC116290565 [Actinia tenebrosa]